MNPRKHKSIRPVPGVKRIQNYLFKFSDLLGKGNFSSVFKGVNQQSNQIVAVKYIALNSLTCERLKELLDQQIQIFTSLNHPNIVKCYEVLKSAHNCYIITQLCDGGDLETLLKKKRRLSQDEATPYIRDIFQGLYYLSKKNIIHRDIKVANIFINKGKAKLADFGFAQRAKKQFNDGKIGTPLCMSPQGFLQNLYGCKTDVWAFGIILYQLTHGKLHLEHCTSEQILKQQIQVQLKFDQLRPQLSVQLRQLILKCLDVNPCTRITFQQMRSNSFIRKITQNRMEPFSMQDLRYIPSMHTNQTLPNQSFLISLKNIEHPHFNHLHPHQKTKISEQNQHFNFQYGNNKVCEDPINQFQPLKSDKTEKCICRPPVIQIPSINCIPERNVQSLGSQSPVIFESPFQQNQDYSIQISHKSHSTLPTLNEDTSFSTPQKQKSLISTADREFLDVPVSPMNLPFRRHKGSFEISPTEHTQLIQKTGTNLRATISARVSFDLRRNVQDGVRVNKNQKIGLDVNPLTNTKRLINGFIRFNQAIGLIHFCRLIYKYIMQLKATGVYHQGDLNLRYYSNYLLNILNQLDSKIASDHIILSKGSVEDQTKQNKIQKMQKVVQQYIERYKPNLQKQRADYLNRTTGQIKQIVHLDQKFIQTFYIPDKTKIHSYNHKLVKFTEILEKSSRYQKYPEFDSNQELQEATKDQRKEERKDRQMFGQKYSENSQRNILNTKKTGAMRVTARVIPL